jgi:hypothetical protein
MSNNCLIQMHHSNSSETQELQQMEEIGELLSGISKQGRNEGGSIHDANSEITAVRPRWEEATREGGSGRSSILANKEVLKEEVVKGISVAKEEDEDEDEDMWDEMDELDALIRGMTPGGKEKRYDGLASGRGSYDESNLSLEQDKAQQQKEQMQRQQKEQMQRQQKEQMQRQKREKREEEERREMERMKQLGSFMKKKLRRDSAFRG